ncbi:MAG: kynB [Planctomycetaceae bacterium]|nr:kynB [Planctomycetaceae bacterium]
MAISRSKSCFLLLIIALAGLGFSMSQTVEGVQSKTAQSTAVPTLDQLCTGQLRLIDLSYALNDKNAFWPAANYQAFQLKNLATLEQNGVLSKAFATPEHLGTHLDAPNHFERNQPSVDQIKPENLFATGVVVDVSMQATANPDYALTVQNLTEWEREHNRIPDGSVVLLKTGWGEFWKNLPRYKNQDVMGQLHFPGYSPDAARWLIRERRIKGIGIDTLSIDPGRSKDFAVHHIVNGAGLFGLENVANLEQLPVRGFHLIIAPIKIETGTGGPTRIFAVLPPEK